MIDIWSSSGLRLPRQLTYDAGSPLPAEETYFLQCDTASILPPPARNAGIWAEMTRLARIWVQIQDLNRASVRLLKTSPLSCRGTMTRNALDYDTSH